MEIAAMDGQIARAVRAARMVAERNPREHVGRAPVAAVPAIGMRAHRIERVLAADPPHDLHDVRAEMNPRAEARKRGRLLVQHDVVAGALQQRRGGRAAETGADDCDTGCAHADLLIVSPAPDLTRERAD